MYKQTIKLTSQIVLEILKFKETCNLIGQKQLVQNLGCLIAFDRNDRIRLQLPELSNCMHKIITITQSSPGMYEIAYFTKLWARLGIPNRTEQKIYYQNVASIDIELHPKYQDNMSTLPDVTLTCYFRVLCVSQAMPDLTQQKFYHINM